MNDRKRRTEIKKKIAFERRNGGKGKYRNMLYHPEIVPESARIEMSRPAYGLGGGSEIQRQNREIVHGHAVDHDTTGEDALSGVQDKDTASGENVVEFTADVSGTDDSRRSRS